VTSPYELEAMIVSRDAIMAELLKAFVGPKAGEVYQESIQKMDAAIKASAREIGGD